MEGEKKNIYIYTSALRHLQFSNYLLVLTIFCFLVHTEKKIICFILLWGEGIWFVEDN